MRCQNSCEGRAESFHIRHDNHTFMFASCVLFQVTCSTEQWTVNKMGSRSRCPTDIETLSIGNYTQLCRVRSFCTNWMNLFNATVYTYTTPVYSVKIWATSTPQIFRLAWLFYKHTTFYYMLVQKVILSISLWLPQMLTNLNNIWHTVYTELICNIITRT